jgi:hypothetical protein
MSPNPKLHLESKYRISLQKHNEMKAQTTALAFLSFHLLKAKSPVATEAFIVKPLFRRWHASRSIVNLNSVAAKEAIVEAKEELFVKWMSTDSMKEIQLKVRFRLMSKALTSRMDQRCSLPLMAPDDTLTHSTAWPSYKSLRSKAVKLPSQLDSSVLE